MKGVHALAIARPTELVAATNALFLRSHSGEPGDHLRLGVFPGKKNFRRSQYRIGADAANGQSEVCRGHGLAGLVKQIRITIRHNNDTTKSSGSKTIPYIVHPPWAEFK